MTSVYSITLKKESALKSEYVDFVYSPTTSTMKILDIYAVRDTVATVDNINLYVMNVIYPYYSRNQRKKNTQLFVFFDLECTQSKPYTDNNERFEHVPNLCVVQQACDTCILSDDVDQICLNCGAREHVFYGCDIIETFMMYLGALPDNFKKVKILAHNFQKYGMVSRARVYFNEWLPIITNKNRSI